jgi:predicted esterase
MLQGRASLLCLRGKRRFAGDPSQGYYYPDHLALRREVTIAVERFEAVAPKARPYVYAGYSQGATMGALAVAPSGDVFSDLLLVEGGFADWSTALVNQFKRSGGRAVLIVCGTQHCRDLARGAVARFTSLGVDAKAVWASGAGHRPDGPVEQRTLDALPFLLQRDERWKGFSVGPDSLGNRESDD